MSNKKTRSYQGIKVNLITGFLGAGKTTLIRQLLTQVPDNETWAVLVNEFGEVGLDKDLLESDLNATIGSSLTQKDKIDKIAIKQVAGGCLCCTTSAAFQVSLNALIKEYNPDRILIEPTGLGHPQKILKQLQSPYYQSVLQLESVLCLLDARVLGDQRYTNHLNFIEQVTMADILIVSKTELYDDKDWQALDIYLSSLKSAKQQIKKIKAGRLDLVFLEQRSSHSDANSNQVNHSDLSLVNSKRVEFKTHFKQTENIVKNNITITSQDENEGHFYFKAVGGELNLAWTFSKEITFDQIQVEVWYQKLKLLGNLLRVKAVFRLTTDRSLLLNATRLDHGFRLVDQSISSKIELILSTDKLSDESIETIKSGITDLVNVHP